MKNAISWFEIPVSDFARAKSFYELIFNCTLQRMEAMGLVSGFFPFDMQTGVGGCIILGPGYEPSTRGSLVYLYAGDDLQNVLDRVSAAGGSILQTKTSLGPNGFCAFILDTEGNKIGLHSRN